VVLYVEVRGGCVKKKSSGSENRSKWKVEVKQRWKRRSNWIAVLQSDDVEERIEYRLLNTDDHVELC